MNIKQINFEKYLADLGQGEAQLTQSPSFWFDKMAMKLIRGDVLDGDTLPWHKTRNFVRLRPAEISIWAGMNGHRKSMLTGQVALHLTKSSVVAMASLEMKPEETLFRMFRQSSTLKPDGDGLVKFTKWMDERMVVYDQLDKIPWIRILGFIYYCSKELKAGHIFIDSLTKCGIAQGDGVQEKDFIDRLQWAAKTLGCHIHLICHVRKPQSHGDEYIPNKFDIRGAGEISDMADNVFVVWKDKRREGLMKKHALSAQEMDYVRNSVDQFLIVEKQRHGSWEGKIGLWFDQLNMQFQQDEGTSLDFEFVDEPDRSNWIGNKTKPDLRIVNDAA